MILKQSSNYNLTFSKRCPTITLKHLNVNVLENNNHPKKKELLNFMDKLIKSKIIIQWNHYKR
jgi:hypothetical protein